MALDTDYLNDPISSAYHFNGIRQKYGGAYAFYPSLSQPEKPTSVGTSSNVSLRIKSTGNSVEPGSFQTYQSDYCAALTNASPFLSANLELAALNINNPSSWANLEMLNDMLEQGPQIGLDAVSTSIQNIKDQFSILQRGMNECDNSKIYSAANSILRDQETIFEMPWIKPEIHFMLYKAGSIASAAKFAATNRFLSPVKGTQARSLNQVVELVLKQDLTRFVNGNLVTRFDDYFAPQELKFSSIMQQFLYKYAYSNKTTLSQDDLIQLKGWISDLNTIANEASISSIGFGLDPAMGIEGFSTKNIFLAVLPFNPLVGMALVVGSVALSYALTEQLRREEDAIKLPDPAANIRSQVEMAVELISLIQKMGWSYEIYPNEYTFDNIPYVDNGTLSKPQGKWWDSYLDGGKIKPVDLPNWEPYDGGHHIIQKGENIDDLSKARRTLNNCFNNSNPNPFNQRGLDSKSNIADLHPWFHAYLHNKTSQKNMNRFLEELFNSDARDTFGQCNLHGTGCQKVEDFLNKVKAYLENLSAAHKAEIQKMVMDYLYAHLFEAGLRVENIAEILDAIGFKNPFFTRQNGPRAGKIEVNRVLYNKSKENVKNSNTKKIGLTKEQRDVIEAQHKKRVESGDVRNRLPKYVETENLDIKDLCAEMNKEMKNHY